MGKPMVVHGLFEHRTSVRYVGRARNHDHSFRHALVDEAVDQGGGSHAPVDDDADGVAPSFRTVLLAVSQSASQPVPPRMLREAMTSTCGNSLDLRGRAHARHEGDVRAVRAELDRIRVVAIHAGLVGLALGPLVNIDIGQRAG